MASGIPNMWLFLTPAYRSCNISGICSESFAFDMD